MQIFACVGTTTSLEQLCESFITPRKQLLPVSGWTISTFRPCTGRKIPARTWRHSDTHLVLLRAIRSCYDRHLKVPLKNKFGRVKQYLNRKKKNDRLTLNQAGPNPKENTELCVSLGITSQQLCARSPSFIIVPTRVTHNNRSRSTQNHPFRPPIVSDVIKLGRCYHHECAAYARVCVRRPVLVVCLWTHVFFSI